MPFRCQYKTIGLTYSRCPMSKETLLSYVQEKVCLENYYIVQETHKSEGDCRFHLHAWFLLANKPNIKSDRYFDFDGYHPNIGKKNKSWIFNYLVKQDKKPLTDIENGYVELAASGNYKESLSMFIRMHPKEYILHRFTVENNLRSLGRKDKEMVYPLTTTQLPEWDMTKSLLIHGPTRLGKTQFAKSYVTHYLKKTFFRINHIDRLRHYCGQDVIIWDDMNFTHLPRETGIHIATTTDSRDIHMRNIVAHIPAGILNIFVSNIEEIFPADYTGAIASRIQKWAPQLRFY